MPGEVYRVQENTGNPVHPSIEEVVSLALDRAADPRPSDHQDSHFDEYVRGAVEYAGEAAVNPRIGYGANHPPGAFGEMLNQTFTSRSRQYNVELRYQGKNVTDERGRLRMVYRGEASEGAVVASHRVTLYDNQSLSGPYAENAELWEYSTNATNNEDGYYPIPNAIDGPVYNVVEVRVIVW